MSKNRPISSIRGSASECLLSPAVHVQEAHGTIVQVRHVVCAFSYQQISMLLMFENRMLPPIVDAVRVDFNSELVSTNSVFPLREILVKMKFDVPSGCCSHVWLVFVQECRVT